MKRMLSPFKLQGSSVSGIGRKRRKSTEGEFTETSADAVSYSEEGFPSPFVPIQTQLPPSPQVLQKKKTKKKKEKEQKIKKNSQIVLDWVKEVVFEFHHEFYGPIQTIVDYVRDLTLERCQAVGDRLGTKLQLAGLSSLFIMSVVFSKPNMMMDMRFLLGICDHAFAAKAIGDECCDHLASLANINNVNGEEPSVSKDTFLASTVKCMVYKGIDHITKDAVITKRIPRITEDCKDDVYTDDTVMYTLPDITATAEIVAMSKLRKTCSSESQALFTTLLGVVVREKSLDLVMPFVGQTLFDYIVDQEQPTTLTRQKLGWMRDAIQAVVVLHGVGISHRDLHAGNFLIHHLTHKLILADFDTCSPNGHLRSTRPVAALWARAPETFENKDIAAREDYDSTMSDVWSLGALLCFIVTGYIYTSKVKTVENLRLEITKILNNVRTVVKDDVIYNIISDMLKENPRDRPVLSQSMVDMFG
jgi:hypothetical protein